MLARVMGGVGEAFQNAMATAYQMVGSPIVPASPTGEETDEQMEAMREAIKARKEAERREDARGSVDPRSDIGRPSRMQFESPALPDQDVDELSPDAPRVKLRATDQDIDELSPDASGVNLRIEEITREEDDLPETPEALRRQMEVDDLPPRGVLFSSPSKRRRRQPKYQRRRTQSL